MRSSRKGPSYTDTWFAEKLVDQILSFHLSVRDTGPGVSAADQAKLFQEFQQADNAITRKKGGTGLGIAISKRIIEMHGGKIWVESPFAGCRSSLRGGNSTAWNSNTTSIPTLRGRRADECEAIERYLRDNASKRALKLLMRRS